MKILLANPPILLPQKGDEELYFIKAGSRWPHTIFKKRSMASPYLPFPFFLGYAAGLLEADGFEVEVLDSVALNQTPAEFLREAAALSPDLVLIETSTPTIDYDLETAKRLRQQSGCRTALAGPHVTVFAADVLAANPEIDFILLGEYETNFLELARALAAGADPASVGGVAHRRDGVPAVVPSPGLVEPLDRLPHPARHLFPSNRRSDAGAYFDIINRRKPAVQLHSSRGCPFRCSYCLWVNVMYASGRYRMFTPGYVVGEMEEAVERFGAREIYFDDDTFSINRSHVEGILGEIETRGLGVSWSCMADAVGLDGPLLERMARAGCVGVKFGVESAAPAVLAHLEKPVDLGKVREIVKTCFDLGIRTHASFMFGLEGETPETVDETVAFLGTVPLDSVQISYRTPFPGTPAYDRLRKDTGRSVAWSEFDGKRRYAPAGETPGEFLAGAESRAVRAFLRGTLRSPRRLLRKAGYLGRFLVRGDTVLWRYYLLKMRELIRSARNRGSVDFSVHENEPS